PIADTSCSKIGSINCRSPALASGTCFGNLVVAKALAANMVLSSKRGVDDALEETIVAMRAIIARANMTAKKAAECQWY
ncbi:MAG: hypothetical protein AAB281_03900, partial [Actinomycetota bacterium]